jgi:protein-arginine kinase activator protein McsA
MGEPLCENCGQRPATVRLTRIVRGVPLESHVCDACSGKPELGEALRCEVCRKSYTAEELKALFQANPPPEPLDPDSFRKWESGFTCTLCGQPLFAATPDSLFEFYRNDPMLRLLRRRRPPFGEPNPT